MKRYIIGLLLFSFLWNGCCTTKSLNCTNPEMKLTYIGYSIIQLDTVYINMYKENDGFKTLIKTNKIYCNRNSMGTCNNYIVANDTVSINNADVYIGPGYDWTFYVTSSGQTDSLSGIIASNNTTKYKDCDGKLPACANTLISYNLNGNLINNNVSTPPGLGYSLFINKK